MMSEWPVLFKSRVPDERDRTHSGRRFCLFQAFMRHIRPKRDHFALSSR